MTRKFHIATAAIAMISLLATTAPIAMAQYYPNPYYKYQYYSSPPPPPPEPAWERQEDANYRAQQENRREAAAQDAQVRERDAAEQQHAREEAARQLIDNQNTTDADAGYQPMSIEDFILDGAKLADRSADVSIAGYYAHVNGATWIFPSMTAYYLAINSTAGASPPAVIVLSDDAPRIIRKYLLEKCGSMLPVGCTIRLRGEAAECDYQWLGYSGEIPCLKIENAWLPVNYH